MRGVKVIQSEFGDGRPGKTRRRTTDAKGRFSLSATYNFHLFIGPEGVGWPSAHYYENVIITYTNYLVYEIDGMHEFKGVIHLQPVYPLEVSGRLLDERTKAPVEGATVSFTAYPALYCVSDAAGRFCLEASSDFYRAYQRQGPFTDRLSVEHPKFWVTGFHCGDDGDILLHPYE
jgi:hypothetical protein